MLFALGGLALSLALSVITYTLADRYLLGQREGSASRQTYLNARAFRDEILVASRDTAEALNRLEVPSTSSVVVERGGEWFASSIAIGRASVPSGLRRMVEQGVPAKQRINLAGDPHLVIGLPIPAVDGEYFEVFSLNELDKTLGVVRNALVGAAAATTLLAALLGFWASRRVLQPLTAVGGAAAEIAEGDLTRRLEDRGDPDLHELTESFNRMVDALQLRIERDARFASSVSHELRSPLTTLAAGTEMLAVDEAALPSRARVALHVLRTDVARFQSLVEDLLELSRAEADVDEVFAEPVRLGELVLHSTGTVTGPVFPVAIDPAAAAEPMLTDKRRLERVLANLLENARAHGDGVARVGLERRGDHVRITVDDHGTGVAPEEREQVFERFYRGAAAGRRDPGSGTGLGLALVLEHVRILRGKVWVEDSPDTGGARFVVELPWEPA